MSFSCREKIKLNVSEIDKLFGDEKMKKNISISKYTNSQSNLLNGKNYMKLLNYGFDIANEDLVTFGDKFYTMYLSLKFAHHPNIVVQKTGYPIMDNNIKYDDIDLYMTPKQHYDFIWNLGEYEIRWCPLLFDDDYIPNNERIIHPRCEAALKIIMAFFEKKDPLVLELEHTQSLFM